jgi:hypothetical protein
MRRLKGILKWAWAKKLYIAPVIVILVCTVRIGRYVAAEVQDSRIWANEATSRQVTDADASVTDDSAGASYADTPEPSSFVALLGGVGGVAFLIKRKRS